MEWTDIISISIGQGEVTLTPLQIANLGATIANRGYFITPHVVKEVEGGVGWGGRVWMGMWKAEE